MPEDERQPDTAGGAPPKKIIVVMPAYNAEKTLRRTYEDLPLDLIDEVILTDDASRDRTVEVARELGITVFVHRRNTGYGGNQKTCYRAALQHGADIVVMVHPDHQYDPRMVRQLVAPILSGQADAVFGSRMLGGHPLEGGMPVWKYIANVLLTAAANIIVLHYLTETHSGFRAYSRRYLESIRFDLNSNDFVFDTEIILQGRIHGFEFREIPIQTRYFPEASSINLARSTKYGLSVLWALIRFRLHTSGIWRQKQFA